MAGAGAGDERAQRRQGGDDSGIGRATALAFVGSGAAVVIADAGGKQTVALVNERGGDALFVHTDVAQAREVEQLLARTVNVFGGPAPRLRAEIQQMLAGGGGSIVNTSSVAAIRGFPGPLPTAPPKGA